MRGMMGSHFFQHIGKWSAALLLALCSTTPAIAQAHLQCVPYAREVSGIDIHGNAWTWWDQASGLYERGQQPRVGAVLAFRATAAMPFGHVAVVSQVVDSRHLLLDHANWSGPGRIEHAALAEDVSEAGDWSSVRVWYAPAGGLGSRTNPTYGFIYTNAPAAATSTTSLAAREDANLPAALNHG
jgi:surface antigen